MIFSWSDVILPGTFRDVWRYFWLSQFEKALLESGGKMISYHALLQFPGAKYIPAQNGHSAKVLWICTVRHRITSQCGSWALAVWLERIDMCCQCPRHTRLPKTSCKNVNYHVNTSTFWNSILNIFVYIKYILKINLTYLFLFFCYGAARKF